MSASPQGSPSAADHEPKKIGLADIFGDDSDLSSAEEEDDVSDRELEAVSKRPARSATPPSDVPSSDDDDESGADRFSPGRSQPKRKRDRAPSVSDDEYAEAEGDARPATDEVKKSRKKRTPEDEEARAEKKRLKEAGRRKKKVQMPQQGVGSDGEELPEMDEATRRKLELSARIESIGKGMKKKRKIKKATADGEEDLTADVAIDNAIEATRTQMEDAVKRDRELNAQGKPAINKIRLLPRVLSVMQNFTMQQAILDSSEFLECIRQWLEPLGDGSLPSLNIQRSILVQLSKMDITKENLKESGLGKIILFYTRSKRVQSDIARIANELYDRWSRLVLHQGATERRVMNDQRANGQREEDSDRSEDERDVQQRTNKKARRDPGQQLLMRKVEDRDEDDLLAASARTTRIPSQIGHAYHEAPKPIRSLHDASQQAQLESRMREHEKLNRFKRKALMAKTGR